MKFPGGMLDQSVSTIREPLCEGFPIRHGTIAAHRDRKLFAHSFPFDMTLSYLISIGNLSPMVSHPTWHHCCSSRQETVREQFPIRHDTIVFHLNRKPFAYGFPSDMAPLLLISTGNCLLIVSHPAWHHCVSSQQETFRLWFPIRHGTIAAHHDRKPFANGDFSTPLRSARNDSAAWKALVSFRFYIDHFHSYAYGLENFQYDCKLPATHVISSGATCRYEDKELALY